MRFIKFLLQLFFNLYFYKSYKSFWHVRKRKPWDKDNEREKGTDSGKGGNKDKEREKYTDDSGKGGENYK